MLKERWGANPHPDARVPSGGVDGDDEYDDAAAAQLDEMIGKVRRGLS